MRTLLTWLVVAAFLGCARTGSDTSTTAGNTVGVARDSSGGGSLRLLLSDAPLDGVTAVNICFERVDVKFSDAPETTILSNPGTFDLLSLQNGVTAELGVAQLPSGVIQQIRIIVCQTGSNVVVDGQTKPLTIPSGTESGLKLTKPGGFVIQDNLTTTVIADFDAGHSVHFAPGNGYTLKPVVHLVDAVEVAITSPSAGDLIATQPFTVTGTFNSRLPEDPVASVVVNGAAATLGAGSFAATTTTSLAAANATITAVATTSQGIVAVVDIVVRVLAVDPATSSITVSPSAVSADGSSQGTITVRLATTSGAPVAGLPASDIHVTVEDSNVTQPTSPTGADGTTTARVTSTTAGLKHVSADIGNATGGTVTIQGPLASFVAVKNAHCGDGVLDPGEACDDGNNVSDDGCRADCLGTLGIERHYNQPFPVRITRPSAGTFVVECSLCDRIVSVSAHQIPNLFQVGSRATTAAAVVVDISSNGRSATLRQTQATPSSGFLSLAFDITVEAYQSTSVATASGYYRVHADGTADELSWTQIVCDSHVATCAHNPDGSVKTVFLPVE